MLIVGREQVGAFPGLRPLAKRNRGASTRDPMLADEDRILGHAKEQENVATDKTGANGTFAPSLSHSGWSFWKHR